MPGEQEIEIKGRDLPEGLALPGHVHRELRRATGYG